METITIIHVCAWCGRSITTNGDLIHDIKITVDDKVSHGICKECYVKTTVKARRK